MMGGMLEAFGKAFGLVNDDWKLERSNVRRLACSDKFTGAAFGGGKRDSWVDDEDVGCVLSRSCLLDAWL